jgi:hypothetical protein
MASSRVDDVDRSEADAAELSEWGGEPLAQFFAAAWRNTVRSLTSEAQQYGVLAEIDGIYRQLITDEESNQDKRFLTTFLVRAHGAHLAAASLALSGQVAEAYVLMRASLETALKGLFIADSPERQQLWIGRNDNDEASGRASAMFNGPEPLANLQTVDAATAGVYQQLHDRTADRQFHANTLAVLSRDAPSGSQGADFTQKYFVLGDEVQRSCLRSVAQVGLCCLTIFYYAFPDRYRELELDVRVKQLRRGH